MNRTLPAFLAILASCAGARTTHVAHDDARGTRTHETRPADQAPAPTATLGATPPPAPVCTPVEHSYAPCEPRSRNCPVRAAVEFECRQGSRPPIVRVVGDQALGAVLTLVDGWAVSLIDDRSAVREFTVPIESVAGLQYLDVQALHDDTLWISANTGDMTPSIYFFELSLARREWVREFVARMPVPVWLSGLAWNGTQPSLFAEIPQREMLRYDATERPGDGWTLASTMTAGASARGFRIWTEGSEHAIRPVTEDVVRPETTTLQPRGHRTQTLVLHKNVENAELFAYESLTRPDSPATLVATLPTDAHRANGQATRCDAPTRDHDFDIVDRDSLGMHSAADGSAWVVAFHTAGVVHEEIERRCMPLPPGYRGHTDPCRCQRNSRVESSVAEIVVSEVTPSNTLVRRWSAPLTQDWRTQGLIDSTLRGRSLVLEFAMWSASTTATRHELLWLDLDRLAQ